MKEKDEEKVPGVQGADPMPDPVVPDPVVLDSVVPDPGVSAIEGIPTPPRPRTLDDIADEYLGPASPADVFPFLFPEGSPDSVVPDPVVPDPVVPDPETVQPDKRADEMVADELHSKFADLYYGNKNVRERMKDIDAMSDVKKAVSQELEAKTANLEPPVPKGPGGK